MGFTVVATLAAGLALLGSWRVSLFLGFLIALSRHGRSCSRC